MKSTIFIMNIEIKKAAAVLGLLNIAVFIGLESSYCFNPGVRRLGI